MPKKSTGRKGRFILPIAVFLYMALCYALHPQSVFYTHQLYDSDDYMRLTQVANWINSPHPFGADWFDVTQPRLSPGEHVNIHWSRLVDIPIALAALPFAHTVGLRTALMWAAGIVPFFLLMALLLVLTGAARPLIEKSRSGLTAVMVIFAPALLVNFGPGRVDHHTYSVLFALFGVMALQRIVLCPKGWKMAIAAAITYACALWIGTEGLPWAALFVAGLAVAASIRGGFVMRNAAVFGIAFPISVAIALIVARQPQEYTSRAVTWFSGADLVFAFLSGAALIGSSFITRDVQSIWKRMLCVGALGIAASASYFILVPDILHGVYANSDEHFTYQILGNIGEAVPFLKSLNPDPANPVPVFYQLLVCLQIVYMPSFAAAISGWKMLRAKAWRTRIVWGMHLLFVVPALLLTLFWQLRVAWLAEAFSLVPVAWFLTRAWACVAVWRISPRKKFWAEIFIFLMIAAFPVLLLPNMVGGSKLYPDIALYPATREERVCPLFRATDFINARYGDRKHLILATANDGPQLLFRTDQKVLTALYSIDSNKDTFAFFNARDDRQAMGVALAHNVELVLVCHTYPIFYADQQSPLDEAAKKRVAESGNAPTLIERLASVQPPDWLRPVEIPGDPDYVLYEVK